MEIIFRGKHSFDDCCSKEDLIKRCDEIQDWFETLPDEVVIRNMDDDYIYLKVDPKDKDDRKYYKSLGFRREND